MADKHECIVGLMLEERSEEALFTLKQWESKVKNFILKVPKISKEITDEGLLTGDNCLLNRIMHIYTTKDNCQFLKYFTYCPKCGQKINWEEINKKYKVKDNNVKIFA